MEKTKYRSIVIHLEYQNSGHFTDILEYQNFWRPLSFADMLSVTLSTKRGSL
jgi:hypothetical protein